METSIVNNKKSLLEKLGRVSESKINWLGFAAVGIVILQTGIIGTLAIIMRHTDFSLYKHMALVQKYVFPIESIIAIMLYVIIISMIIVNKLSLRRILSSNPVFGIFSVMIIMIFISRVYNGLGYALDGYQEMGVGETFDMEVGYFAFVLFNATQVKKEKHKRFLLRCQIVVSIILVVAGFVIWNVDALYGYIATNRPEGFCSIFGNSNYYGYFLSFSVPLAASGVVFENKLYWKIICGISFVANTVALSINECIGAWVGAVVGIIFISIVHCPSS